MDTLVTTDWLNAQLHDPDLVVLDCTVYVDTSAEQGWRVVGGRANFTEGHVPGSQFADLLRDLADTESPLVLALPTPERLAAALGDLGVGDETRVVVYDDNGSMWAARVWWMLRWVGHDRAAILDGGLKAWKAEGRPLSSDTRTPAPRTLTPRPRPAVVAHIDEVRAGIAAGSLRLIDSLNADSYLTGHIPGAENVDARDLIDRTGRYRSRAELKAMLDGKPDARTITYCGGGVAAASTAFALTRLGFSNVAVYVASMQEWAADPGNPIEIGVP